MIKTVLPLGAKSPNIPTLWGTVAYIKKIAPAAIPDGDGIAWAHGGGITASNGGGSSCIDQMPGVALIT